MAGSIGGASGKGGWGVNLFLNSWLITIIVVTSDYFRNAGVSTINLKEAKAGFSSLVDDAIKGEFVTITRHGKPVAALVSVEAAEIARKVIERSRSGLVSYLRTFPGGEFERNTSPSRDVEF